MTDAPEKALEIVPFVSRQCGWMKCVACSDSRRRVGMMWLGLTRRTAGTDIFVPCVVCHGTGQVPRYKHFDARTMLEIDYERPGQKFVLVNG